MKHEHYPVEKDLNRCPRCNKCYDFWTEGGRLKGPRHPFGACKPPRHNPVTSPSCSPCSECGEIISESRPGANTLTCSAECKKLRDERLRKERDLQKKEVRDIQKADSKVFYEKYQAARLAKKQRRP